MRKSSLGMALLVAAAAVILTGCGSGDAAKGEQKRAKTIDKAVFKPGDELAMWPMKEGNQWTYTLTSVAPRDGRQAQTVSELTLRVEKVTPKADGVTAVLAVLDRDGARTETQVWDVDKQGIYQIRAGAKQVPFEPRQPALLYPPDPGKIFKWKGTGLLPVGSTGASESASKVLDAQEVDIEQGRVSAFPVETAVSFTLNRVKGISISTAYWKPGVGLVRYRQEIAVGNANLGQLMILKAYVVK